MSQQAEIRELTLAGIAHRCREETEHFFKARSHDPRYCFELFRRAIVGRIQQAWDLIYAQYRPLVTGWVERHSGYPSSGEEAQYFVNRAFEKMWGAVPSDRFGQFANLSSLLRYLQMCVHSVIMDQLRGAERQVVESSLEESPVDHAEHSVDVEQQALGDVKRAAFWREVDSRLQNEQERQVVYGSFVLGLKPRQLCEQFPDKFGDVREIYRVKENVLARLRRDERLQEVLQDAL
jgi:DNA-directed RNA polymerase specialized sigma24 family protein